MDLSNGVAGRARFVESSLDDAIGTHIPQQNISPHDPHEPRDSYDPQDPRNSCI